MPFQNDMAEGPIPGHGTDQGASGPILTVSRPVLGGMGNMKSIGCHFRPYGFRGTNHWRQNFVIQTEAGFDQGCHAGCSAGMSDVGFDRTQCPKTRCIQKYIGKCLSF